ncbi:lipocalin family protein [Tateyamaria armeniaca]|uniref:Lipocalin family protein n=1 Tax=Tateyamaria armeniaca TaxID=2518930 RepID=A0ABW8UTZ6_9RHOB
MACTNGANPGGDPSLLRNPTVPIGAIQRFELSKFDGDWRVHSHAGGGWNPGAFTVSDAGTTWRAQGQTATIAPRATGILQLTYADGTQRDLWVVWTDPDHHTVAVGNPEGDFGFIATRVGRFRADQVAAAAQVLDFNGYRTDEWAVRAK